MATGRRTKSKTATVDHGGKDFLTDAEMKRFLDVSRHSRNGVRDYTMMLMAFRHGLRVSELVDVRMKDLDLETALIYAMLQKKGGSFNASADEGEN